MENTYYIILKREIDNIIYYYPALIHKYKHSEGNILFIGDWDGKPENGLKVIPCRTKREAAKKVKKLKIPNKENPPYLKYTLLYNMGFTFC